ncbi:MAG: hypothetical protein KatS3mg077_0366 [Candidatus Binatia bacterium]|nr:MAG: hypothetical protein KatS3mg077_0366 [Candidatus Binatia bacterium]
MGQSARNQTHTPTRLRPVSRVSPDTSVAQAARTMYQRGEDAVAVVDAHGELIGIFTARDVVGAVAAGLELSSSPVGQWLRSPRVAYRGEELQSEIWLG